jgi:plastocyanin
MALIGILVASLTLVVALALTTASTHAQDRPALRLLAGLGEGIVSINDFVGDPTLGGTRVRVVEGTRVVWSLGSDEAHTITFLVGQPPPPVFLLQPEDPSRPPMLNPLLVFPTLPTGPWDGTSFIHVELQQRGQEAEVVFARQGRYEYVCLFHPAMTGIVDVVAGGTPGITSQAAVDQYAALHDWDEHSWQVAEMLATRSKATRIDGPRGTTVAIVRAGTDWRWGHVDLQAFLPEDVTIQQGDTVIWYVDHVQPHTVTFPAADGSHPDFIVIQLPDGRRISPAPPNAPPPPDLLALLEDPEFTPRLVLGPGALRTVEPVHDGRSLYSSGLIGEHPLVAVPMEKAWGLTFNTPGTFEYHCGLHEQLGMKGTVTVLPR